MTTTHRDEETLDGGSDGKGGRVTVTVDFDQASNPELHALVSAVPPGKQRAQRVRSLMLKGHMFELMQCHPGHGTFPPAARPVPHSGAEDVFGEPLEG